MNDSYSYLLKLDNLNVTYYNNKQEIRAVDGISLQLEKGESLGVVGESGCGKSSLALAIMGLIEDGSVKGSVAYKGQDLLAMSKQQLNKIRWQEISLVFQNSEEVLNPVLTIGEQIADSIESHYNITKDEVQEKVLSLLEMVGLSIDWYKQYPHQLSGGMRQRLLIAMALACEPGVLIIDEPTGSLDPIIKTKIVNLLKQLQDELGFTMILISHDLEIIQDMTSRMMVMYKGRVVEIGITAEVIKEPMHCYTRGLLNSCAELYKFKDLWGIKSEVSAVNDKDACVFYPRCCQRDQNCLKSRPLLRYVGVERMVACHKGGIETFLEARQICKKYKLKNKKEIIALKGANLKIRSGEVVALVGESGSGKSTLANILIGVLPADNGNIRYMHSNIKNKWPTGVIGGMQIVFQDPFSATSDRLTVMEVVTEPLVIIKWGNDNKRKKRAITALNNVQLPISNEFLGRTCRSLSGGQRQRVAIARSLVMEPRLLIADEITSMLDTSTRANILRKLKGLQNQKGFSMLYITHNLHLARKIADKIFVMHNGEIVEAGSSYIVFNKPEHQYTRQLIKNI